MGLITFAVLFYVAAEYEHMTGWKWALASVALSLTVQGLFALSFVLVLPAQFSLFCVMAWANIQRKKKFELERAAREAKEAEELRLRQERVRRVREAREQEERDAAREKESGGQ